MGRQDFCRHSHNWSLAAPWEEAEEKQLKGHTIHPASPGGWQSEIIPELLIRKMLFQVPAKVIRHAEARSQKIKRTLNIFFFLNHSVERERRELSGFGSHRTC